MLFAGLERGRQTLVDFVLKVSDVGSAYVHSDAELSGRATDQPQGRYGGPRRRCAQELSEELVGTVHRCHFQCSSPVE